MEGVWAWVGPDLGQADGLRHNPTQRQLLRGAETPTHALAQKQSDKTDILDTATLSPGTEPA